MSCILYSQHIIIIFHNLYEFYSTLIVQYELRIYNKPLTIGQSKGIVWKNDRIFGISFIPKRPLWLNVYRKYKCGWFTTVKPSLLLIKFNSIEQNHGFVRLVGFPMCSRIATIIKRYMSLYKATYKNNNISTTNNVYELNAYSSGHSSYRSHD